MVRYFLKIEYDGAPFVGWQFQQDGLSVQGVLEKAISKLDGVAVRVYGAGRTDAGVHAIGQVAHVDLIRKRPLYVIQNAVNALVVPHPISIVSVNEVEPHIDARFSAIRRHYLYRISDRRAPFALDRGRVWHYPCAQGLDVEAMQEAAQIFIGYHDFTTFRSSRCQATSPWRTIQKFVINNVRNEIVIEVCARSFLHTQIRSMVGSLCCIGVGKWTSAELEHALLSCDRTSCGPIAPPHGLYLMKIEYQY